MKSFKAFIKVDWRGILRLRNVVVLLLLTAMALYFVQSGVDQYKNLLEVKQEFQELERLRIESYRDYTDYTSFGFRLMLIPGPSIIFFSNTAVISELISHLDAGDVLNLFKSIFGKNLLKENQGKFKDFSGVIFFLGSLLVLYLGLESVRHLEYKRLLESISSVGKLFLLIVLSRIILVALILLFITCCAFLLVLLNDISLPAEIIRHMWGFLGMMTGVMVFFYSCGLVVGGLARSKSTAVLICIVVWILFVFFIPGGVESFISKRAERLPSNYRIDLDKIILHRRFENRAEDSAGKFDRSKRNTKSEIELIESYSLNELKKILELDRMIERESRNLVNLYQRISVFFPTTFYLCTANGVSSGGYESVIDFHHYTRQMKEGFVRYYIDEYFRKKSDKVENFIKGDEAVFTGQSRLGGYFWQGNIMTWLYLVLLLYWGYYLFKRNMFRVQEKKKDAANKTGELKLKKGAKRVLLVKKDRFKDVLYNLFSGQTRNPVKQGFKGKIFLNDKDIALYPVIKDFFYLCHPRHIPGEIKVVLFLDLVSALLKLTGKEREAFYKRLDMKALAGKSFKELEDDQKALLLLSIAALKKKGCYLIWNITKDLSLEVYIRLKEVMNELSNHGSLVVYLTTTRLNQVPQREDSEDEYIELERWENVVESLE
jgi:hypothetical protein